MAKYFRELPFPPIFLLVGIVLLSLIVSTQSFFAAQFFYNHEQKSANYGMSWVVPAVNYSFWALLAPAIYRVSKKVSFDRNQALFGIFFVLFAGFFLATIHEVSTTSLFFLRKLADPGKRLYVFNLVDADYLRYGVASRFMEYLVILVVFMAIDYYKKYAHSEDRIVKMSRDLNEARLSALKMQLQPHFLFNTLNTITALIDENSAAAQEVTCKLSNMLREVLETSEEKEVPVRQEIRFIGYYLDIEQVRYGDRLVVDLAVDPRVENVIIPSLILQPLVENSFKHGFRKKPGACHLRISSTFQDGSLKMSVVDNGTAQRRSKETTGLGLSNVRRRLSHHFGPAAQFDHGPIESGGYCATILIECR